MTAYYNEIDPYAAQWLRNLIEAGHIAPGVVDERSIEDVLPDDLRGFTQCHFFAGIGVWSLALRRAGWSDDRPVWTGSCPCQPFSAAGAGAGFADERHLWPAFFHLITQCKPPIVFGEQVASKAVEPWVDLVHADLEALGYAFGGVPFPSAGVGAPHIRDRLFWVGHLADSESLGSSGIRWSEGNESARGADERRQARRMANADGGDAGAERQQRSGQQRQQPQDGSGLLGLADADLQRQGSTYNAKRLRDASRDVEALRPGPVNGFWRAADWLGCRDDKWRPVEPGTFPLVARPSAELGRVQPGLGRVYGRNRTGRLRGYGNAINAEAATQFVSSFLDAPDIKE